MRALAVAIGAGLVEMWSYKWYILGGLGAYITLRTVKRFVRRNTPDNSSAFAAPHFAAESADASAVLTCYVKEVLQREGLADLDISTLTTNFGCFSETKGPSLAYYCIEHLHMKIVNHVDYTIGATPFLVSLKRSFESLRRMLVLNARQGYRLVEAIDGAKHCMLSKNGQAIGLFIKSELSSFGCWDCCAGNLQDTVILAREYDKLSYMAATRLSNENAVLFDTVTKGPEFIIIACDGVCNLMESMDAVRFVYQGVRAGMELRPLCDVLLDGLLSSGSSAKLVAVFVQFKAEGSSVNM